MLRLIAIALMVMSAGPSVPGHAQTSALEHMDLSCNADGYVITPRPGAARRFPNGALLQAKTYLGKSCDAFNRTLGSGVWCWANGGVNTEFRGKAYGLARMELYCEKPGLSDLGNVCDCASRPLPSWK